MVNIGERIADLREERALTQVELAKIAHISPSTLSLIESGKVEHPHVGTIRKISRALEVSPQELSKGEFPLSGRATARSSARGELTVTVSVPLTLRWNVAEALRKGEQLDPDELHELQEAARAQVTAS